MLVFLSKSLKDLDKFGKEFMNSFLSDLLKYSFHDFTVFQIMLICYNTNQK